MSAILKAANIHSELNLVCASVRTSLYLLLDLCSCSIQAITKWQWDGVAIVISRDDGNLDFAIPAWPEYDTSVKFDFSYSESIAIHKLLHEANADLIFKSMPYITRFCTPILIQSLAQYLISEC